MSPMDEGRSASSAAEPLRLSSSNPAPSSDKKRPRTVRPANDSVGSSKSQTTTRLLNQSLKDGSFVLNPHKWQKFRKSILELDPRAVFPPVTQEDPSQVRVVTHFLCGRKLEMREPYNTVAFKNHVNGTKKQQPCAGPLKSQLSGGGSLPLTQYFSPTPKISSEAIPVSERPCPGLQSRNFPQVKQYLTCSRAPGGGGPSWAEITKKLYPSIERYSQLSTHAKNNVRLVQRSRHRWHNHHDLDRVVSASCLKTVRVPQNISDRNLLPCVECTAILNTAAFKNASALPIPDDDNRKFTPHAHTQSDARAVDVWSRTHGINALIQAYQKVSLVCYICYLSGTKADHLSRTAAAHAFYLRRV